MLTRGIACLFARPSAHIDKPRAVARGNFRFSRSEVPYQ